MPERVEGREQASPERLTTQQPTVPSGLEVLAVEPNTPAGMLRLQRAAGNRAATRVLARQGATADPTADPAIATGEPGILDALGLGADRNPALTSDHTKATFEALDGGVVGTPEPGDVRQGDLGDCYFLASLAAVANAKPSLITGMITDKGSGTFEVRFYKDTAWVGKTFEARTVTVTATFPKEGDDWIYAKPSGNKFWVMLIEKAWGKFKGSYGSAEGGYANAALEAITGRASSEYDVDDYDEPALASIFTNLLSDGWALVAGSVHPWFSGGKKEAKAAGVIAYHEYTIISFDATAKTLELRNPWGYEHITGFSLAKFKQFFRRFWGVPTK
jgi:Calpain family cysteine protease